MRSARPPGRPGGDRTRPAAFRGQAIRRIALAASACVLLFGPSACTVLKIQQRDGAIETRWRVGVVSLELAPGAEGIAAESRTFGFTNGPMGFAFGYQDSTVVGIPETCRLVIWVSSDEELERLDELIEGEDVCASFVP